MVFLCLLHQAALLFVFAEKQDLKVVIILKSSKGNLAYLQEITQPASRTSFCLLE